MWGGFTRVEVFLAGTEGAQRGKRTIAELEAPRRRSLETGTPSGLSKPP